MDIPKMHFLLAEDDTDDCLFFKEALEELAVIAKLTIVNNGEELMHFLKNTNAIPTALFLDINMPLKNGMECLIEIRQKEELNNLPVICIRLHMKPRWPLGCINWERIHIFKNRQIFHN